MCGGKRKYKKRRCQCTVPPILPARGRVLPFCQASDCHIVKSGSQIAWCLEALYDEYITIFVCRRAWLRLERPWRRNLKTELINVAVVADKSVAYLFFLSATVRLSIHMVSPSLSIDNHPFFPSHLTTLRLQNFYINVDEIDSKKNHSYFLQVPGDTKSRGR